MTKLYKMFGGRTVLLKRDGYHEAVILVVHSQVHDIQIAWMSMDHVVGYLSVWAGAERLAIVYGWYQSTHFLRAHAKEGPAV